MVDFNRDRLIAARRLASQSARSTEELLWVASEDSSKCNNALATKVEIIRATKLLSDTLDKGESAIKSTKPALLPYAGEFTIKGFESFTPVHLLAWEYGCRVWDCVNGIIESRVVNSIHGYVPRNSDFEFLQQRGTTFQLPEQSLKQDVRDIAAALQERFDAGDARRIEAEVQREHVRAIQHLEQAPPSDRNKKRKTAKNGARRPTDKQIKVWQIREVTGIENQTELAAKMTKLGMPIKQGSVSKALTCGDRFVAAGGNMPHLPGMEPMEHQPEPITFVDPDVLDMGERQDGLTPCQRESFSRDDD